MNFLKDFFNKTKEKILNFFNNDNIQHFFEKVKQTADPLINTIKKNPKLHKFLTVTFEHIKNFIELLKNIIDKINKNPKQRKICIISGIVLLSLLLFLGTKKIFFSGNKNKKPKTEIFNVRIKKAKKENYTESYSVMGSIKGMIENELRFEIDGVLSVYNFKEGDQIQKGSNICSLDPKDCFTKADFARSKYSSEESAYFSASQKYKIYQDLFKIKAISESKLIEAKYDTQSAEGKMKAALSELELAQSNLAKTNLIAPSDGTLAEIIIKPGEYVTPQDVVAKYVSGGDTNFEVDVPEKDVNKLKIGMKVKIVCDSYPDKEFFGVLSEIAPTVKEKTRTTVVKVSLPNENKLLRSGMFGRGEVYQVEMKDVIIVPSDSIVMLGQATSLVPLVKPDIRVPSEGYIEMRQVKLGPKVNSGTIIEDGIMPGESIVIETQGQLTDGIRVKFTEIEANKEQIDTSNE